MLRDQKVSGVNLVSSSVSWLLRKGRGTQARPSAIGTIMGGLADERPVFLKAALHEACLSMSPLTQHRTPTKLGQTFKRLNNTASQ
ncbi:hypothetical protein DL770_006503 [Monosporascus sp. CRB-9-2]|nr:hypothetical protein DL770_006503 [Monosporascus sp. CRB-9-2]